MWKNGGRLRTVASLGVVPRFNIITLITFTSFLLGLLVNSLPVNTSSEFEPNINNLTIDSNQSLIDLVRKQDAAAMLDTAAQYKAQSLPDSQQLTATEWRRFTKSGTLVTQFGFDARPTFSRIYAYITSDSFNTYLDDMSGFNQLRLTFSSLEDKCRKPDEDNIGDIHLASFENEYFRWEAFNFNKALMHTLFPETAQGNHSRYLNAAVINRIRLGNELENQCEVVEHEDNWSYEVDEKTQFEDYLINRIFRPRVSSERAQAIIKELEGNQNMDKRQGYINPVTANLLHSSGNSTSKRFKRALPVSNKLSQEEVRWRIREYKVRRRV